MARVISDAALAWVEAQVGAVGDVRPLTGGMTSTMLAMSSGHGDVVLRIIDREPWRTHGEGLVARESEVQRMLAGSPVPAPSSVARDAAGAYVGDAAHLMTLLPGGIEPERRDGPSVDALADLLATIHDVRPTIPVRDYQSWAWEAKYVVPDWASDPTVWQDAFALLREAPPAYEPTFLHRDFQPRNVLWHAGMISGVVDWVEASIGPAWLDVAHAMTNLAIVHGEEPALAFAASYTTRTGRPRQPYFEVMDAVGFLPPPGRKAMVTDPQAQYRLERRVRAGLS